MYLHSEKSVFCFYQFHLMQARRFPDVGRLSILHAIYQLVQNFPIFKYIIVPSCCTVTSFSRLNTQNKRAKLTCEAHSS